MNDITHYDDSDYPVGVTCGGCGHHFPIDPATEEGLRTIKDPVHGGRVLVSCCPHCHPEYYDELQARAEQAMALEAALKKKNLQWPRLKTFARRRSWFGWRWYGFCSAHQRYDHACHMCRCGYWSKDGSVELPSVKGPED